MSHLTIYFAFINHTLCTVVLHQSCYMTTRFEQVENGLLLEVKLKNEPKPDETKVWLFRMAATLSRSWLRWQLFLFLWLTKTSRDIFLKLPRKTLKLAIGVLIIGHTYDKNKISLLLTIEFEPCRYYFDLWELIWVLKRVVKPFRAKFESQMKFCWHLSL